MMIDHEYNGPSSGRGKDAVVQLVRACSSEGFPLDVAAWLRAYFAAGGTFHHSESIEELVKEMKAGTKHRVQPRFREDVFELIRERAQERSAVDRSRGGCSETNFADAVMARLFGASER